MVGKELKYGIRQGFSEIAPDIFDDIMERIEKEGVLSEGYGYARNAAEPEKRRISFMRVQRIAAACVMCVLIGIGVFQMSGINTPTYGGEEYTVFMQINPSVRMVFNEEYEILEFKGINADGKALEERLNIEEAITLPEVIEKVVEDGQKQGYLNGENDIRFTFVKKEREQYDQWKNGFAETVEETLMEKRDVKFATTYEESEEGETLEKKLDKEQDKGEIEIEEKAVENKEKTAEDVVKDGVKQNQNVSETEEKSTDIQEPGTTETEENNINIQDQNAPGTEGNNTEMQDQSTTGTEENDIEIQDQNAPGTEGTSTEIHNQNAPGTEGTSTDMQDQNVPVNTETGGNNTDRQDQNVPETEEKNAEKLNQKTPEKDEKAIGKEEKKNSKTNGSQ